MRARVDALCAAQMACAVCARAHGIMRWKWTAHRTQPPTTTSATDHPAPPPPPPGFMTENIYMLRQCRMPDAFSLPARATVFASAIEVNQGNCSNELALSCFVEKMRVIEVICIAQLNGSTSNLRSLRMVGTSHGGGGYKERG